MCGRVGFVELGSTLGCEATVMMSGAWPPAGTLGVVRVNGAARDGANGVLDKAEFVEGVGVQCHLDAVFVGYNAHVVEVILKHVAPGLGWR